MSQGRVLVIEGDEWIADLLEEGLKDANYEVTLASEALEGMRKVAEVQPDCIICDVALPDFDGYWVAHKVRADSSAISTTPFLFLSSDDEEQDSPLEAFNVGADVRVTKPFRLEEVVAQVRALVDMAQRLRSARDSFLDKGSLPPGEALRGSLEQMSLATVLALLEMERRSGQVKVTHEGSEATIDLVGGFATGGTLNAKPAGVLAILREVMKYKSGLVTFRAMKTGGAPVQKKPIAGLLMEAVQLNAMGPTPSPPVAKAEHEPLKLFLGAPSRTKKQ
ncbi:MAG TPA: response regulator [Polyangiaceae bacterium]